MSHSLRNPPLTCTFWAKTGHCSKGEKCHYAHYHTGKVAPAPTPSTSTGGLTCSFWARGRCNKSAEGCLYLHEHTGTVAAPPGRKLIPVTCHFWAKGQCNKQANECQYLHSFTSWVVGPPGTTTTRELTCYFWATPGEECTLAPHHCSYAHHHTGRIAPRPNNIHRTVDLPQSTIQPQASIHQQDIPRSQTGVYPIPASQPDNAGYSSIADNLLELLERTNLVLRQKPNDEPGPKSCQEVARQLEYDELIDRQKSAYQAGNISPPKVLHGEQPAYTATPISSQSSAYALAPLDPRTSISIKGAAQRPKPASPIKLEWTPEPDWQESPYVEEGAYTRGFAVAQDVLDAYVNTRGPVIRNVRVYPHRPSAYSHEGPILDDTQFLQQEPGTEPYPRRFEYSNAYPEGHAIAPDVFGAHVDARRPYVREAKVHPYQFGAHKYESSSSYNTQFNKQESGTETYPQPREQPEAYPRRYATAPEVYDTHHAAKDPEAYRQPRTQAVTPPMDVDPMAWNEYYSPSGPLVNPYRPRFPDSPQKDLSPRKLFFVSSSQGSQESRKRRCSPGAENSPAARLRTQPKRAEDYF